ncbi:imidazole glycerol phosphate synthase subunit HisH [Sphingomonas jaspsi]|uniref:imidazole glycerol phosphate synthase subunit HisH n=1 Tax=Sphingomonas jaspsi TaxID=392409 RepID=UPI0004AF32BC|nr:imidazole glycerol phosphate synthase subunit HisH [Sphingomonas jaspsi]
MTALAILDLGYGNTRSIALAFERLGADPRLTDDPAVAAGAGRLVLPGVGAAGTAMQRLRETGLDETLATRTRPTLGICLGMQLLFERSEEDGGIDLLGILPGEVRALAPKPGFPVPHMGWSRIEAATDGTGVDAGDYVYFAHGYVCPDGTATSATSMYGDATVPAAIRLGHLWAAQFHPERSSSPGANFLKAFLRS